MTNTVVEPDLDDLRAQIQGAFTGAVAYPNGGQAHRSADIAAVVSPVLDAYRSAVKVNPAKAFSPRSVTATPLNDPRVLGDKDFWSDLMSVVAQVAPVIIGALTKDYNPPSKGLPAVIAEIPENLRND